MLGWILGKNAKFPRRCLRGERFWIALRGGNARSYFCFKNFLLIFVCGQNLATQIHLNAFCSTGTSDDREDHSSFAMGRTCAAST